MFAFWNNINYISKNISANSHVFIFPQGNNSFNRPPWPLYLFRHHSNNVRAMKQHQLKNYMRLNYYGGRQVCFVFWWDILTWALTSFWIILISVNWLQKSIFYTWFCFPLFLARHVTVNSKILLYYYFPRLDASLQLVISASINITNLRLSGILNARHDTCLSNALFGRKSTADYVNFGHWCHRPRTTENYFMLS